MKPRGAKAASSRRNFGRAPAPARIAQLLIRWFAGNARDLPWRRDRTAWSALVAESMLQQTQVSRVVERYAVFMKRFPSPRLLAGASQQDVLALWQGMGYYRRAISLHRAAAIIQDRHQGRVPSELDELLQLPGVGRYTAGAIASIVFNQPQPIVDGNVHRVLSRLFMHRGRPENPDSQRWVWREAEALVQAANHPGAVNEAIMELGATVCTPRSPECRKCPLSRLCLAHRAGKEEHVPVPKARRAPSVLHLHAFLMKRRGRVLMQQRKGGLWAGMWQVPTIEADRPLALGEVLESLEFNLIEPKLRRKFKHQTTHRSITFHVYEASVRGRARGTWCDAAQLHALPMSAPQRRMLEWPELD